jgi:XTP/dITP diphosphohydrolase
MNPELTAFQRLIDIIEELRHKCPWDKQQTFDTLRCLTVEEVYELSDTIVDRCPDEMKKELGDIIMHIVFYASIAREQGLFDLADVINGVCDKLVKRHPHIYGENADAIKPPEWEKIKMKEGRKSVLDGVPSNLPSLIKAYRMVEKTTGVGFKWESPSQAQAKVEEEYREVCDELQQPADKQNAEEELGDLLFAIAAWAKTLGINPDDALEKSNRKFKRRFQNVEQQAAASGKPLSDMDTPQLIQLWKNAKSNEKPQ